MKNTTENNKLIAEFLGGIKQPFEFPQFGYINSKGDWKDTFFDDQLKFHSDWNWLMQVVEKIESLGFETSLTNQNFFIRIAGGNTQSGIMYKNKIEAVYNACLEFIKWYNK